MFGVLPLLFFILGAPGSYAGEWPTVDDIYVRETFKYPLMGVRGHEVRPTQSAVGFSAIREKRKEMNKISHDELRDALLKEPIPVVAAPDGAFYMIDHHHQALAAHQVGRENAFFVLQTDYSKLPDMKEFWVRMREKSWVREFDHRGRPIKIPDGLPRSILGLRDDPYRGLAWFVRRSGGYRKTSVEFAEFRWADFFRTRISIGNPTSKEWKAIVEEATRTAHSPEAKGLPGWSARKVECKGLLETEI